MSAQPKLSPAESLALLPRQEWEPAIQSLSDPEALEVLYDWRGFWARPNQILPEGDWRYWLLLAGRGFGKTRVGAETVREWVNQGYRRIHLVGPTASSARDTMVQGESGLLACFPASSRPLYEPSKRLITFHTGAVAYIFSAEEPERLRGPQCECFWADELAAWQNANKRAELTWDNLLFGLRLGNDPRGVITTTPRPIPLIKDLISNPLTMITRGSSYDNRANLAPAFFDAIIRKYEGTRTGRQELLAELLEDIPGALWTLNLIEKHRKILADVPPLQRVVVAIDPAVTAGEDSDETGIGVVGIGHDQHLYVLEDASLKASPGQWARVACRMLLKWDADRIVAEVNNGGDLVEANLRGVHPDIPYRAVRATRGKYTRAEPAAALYEQGRVHHVGMFPELEQQMCEYVPGVTDKSPDRMDWLVWALYDLVLDSEDRAVIYSTSRVDISPY